MSDRDERLGAALRGLEVPDHGPDFYPRLTARLEEEAASHRGSPVRPRWTKAYLLTTVAAVAVVVLAATTVLNSERPRQPRIETKLITASEVRSRVAGALASLETLRGEIALEREILDGPAEPRGRITLRWSFVTTADGDERITGIGVTDDVAFSSATRTHRELTDSGRGPQGFELANASAGPPDFLGRRLSPLRRELGSVVRAFVTDTSEVPVTDTVEQGRDAWRLFTPVVPNKLAGPGGSGDRLEVVVDRQSGFPLRITESIEGRFLQEIRLSSLVVDEPADPATFVIDFPPKTEVFREDAGLRRVTLGQAAAIVGYRPVLPTDVPAGFELTEVTAATRGGGTGNEGLNPAADGVVSVAYRRGFDRLVVTTRLAGDVARCPKELPGSGASACWSDPLASGRASSTNPRHSWSAAGGWPGRAPSWWCRPGASPMCGASTTAWWPPSAAMPPARSSAAWRSRSRPDSYRRLPPRWGRRA